MANVSKNYPYGLTEKEIYEVIKSLSQETIDSGANVNVVLRFTPLIQLGQNELQKRIVERSATTAEKAERIAIGIALFSIILSFVAIGFSYKSSKSDEIWQKEETRLLTEIKQQMKNEQETDKTSNEILNSIKSDLEKLEESAVKNKIQ